MNLIASSFNTEFWTTTAALIPALWLTAGLATAAVAALLHRLTPSETFSSRLDDLQKELALHPKTRYWITKNVALVTKVRLKLFSLPSIFFIYVFAGAGIVGESLAMWELLRRRNNSVLVVVAASCVAVLLVMSAVILMIGMKATYVSSTSQGSQQGEEYGGNLR